MSSQSSKYGAMSSAKTKRHKTFKTEMQRSVEALDPRRNLPLNRYNLYCILERQRLVQSNPDYRPSENERKLPSDIYTGYEGLQLPQMPPRYQDVVVAEDWFVPGKRKLVKRPHRKVHGMFSLKEISRLTADTWKTIDKETLDYLTTVARLILERYKQIEKDLGGPLAKKSRSKTIRKTSLPEQPPKASTSTSLSADTYASLCSPPTNSKGDKDVCLEPLNLHDVDDFWESAAACPQASLSQGTSAVGHRQQSVVSGLLPFTGGLEVGNMEPAEIGRLCLPNISDLETNWMNAVACPQTQPRPSRRASVGHTAPVSHAAAMSHLKPLSGLTVGNTKLKEFRRLSLPNLSDLKANGEGRTCFASFIEQAAMQRASTSLGRLPVQAQSLATQQHSRTVPHIGLALLNNNLPLSATSNHDFPFATDGGTNVTRQNVSTYHVPITSSCGTSDSSINSVFNEQGPREFGLESDGKYRHSIVSLGSSEHSIAASRHPYPADIISSMETRRPSTSGLVHQMTREDCNVNLLMERLVQGDMSDAVNMSDDDITQMLSSSH